MIDLAGEMYLMDLDLKPVKKTASGLLPFAPFLFDEDSDGIDEMIFYKEDRTGFRIYRENFRHPINIDMPYSLCEYHKVSFRKRPGQNTQIAVSTKDKILLYDYKTNNAYWIRYVFFGMAYLLSLVVIMLVQYFTRRRLQRRLSIERQLSTLQMNTIINQLDPHFTFNILNSIGSSILFQDKEKAYKLLLQFSSLIRDGLANSEVICRSLDDELVTLTTYLDLQKLAYPGRFDYVLNISDTVNRLIPIPKMLLQTHAENALKHGILPGSRQGMIIISIDSDGKNNLISIEDNGIGRAAAALFSKPSTGKGIRIFSQVIAFFNNLNTHKMSQELVDLYDEEGNALGTRVEIQVPVRYHLSVLTAKAKSAR